MTEDARERRFLESAPLSVLQLFESKKAIIEFDDSGSPTLLVSRSLTPEEIERVEDALFAYLKRTGTPTFLFETFE